MNSPATQLTAAMNIIPARFVTASRRLATDAAFRAEQTRFAALAGVAESVRVRASLAGNAVAHIRAHGVVSRCGYPQLFTAGKLASDLRAIRAAL